MFKENRNLFEETCEAFLMTVNELCVMVDSKIALLGHSATVTNSVNVSKQNGSIPQMVCLKRHSSNSYQLKKATTNQVCLSICYRYPNYTSTTFYNYILNLTLELFTVMKRYEALDYNSGFFSPY